ncbi:acyltransferase [Micromonospora harpali]|uniref:Acetyltransferase (Isoleucine patch superfamily) n=2 Tax=Micromonospora TaxID=1873 RepID=A0A1C4WZU8_9ACTN|nr:acyltransferase [Micromonospora haikouensis]SCF01735.1 Acetyltransferase (isoleucine patch superfamily) [Micromonospora haikouensis]
MSVFSADERSNRLRTGILDDFVGGLLNDVERARYLGLPETTRIRERTKIVSPENLVMGEHCWIGENTVLDASGGLEIGDHTSIGLNCLVFTHSSWLANMMLENHPGSDLIERKPVRIGKGCFIGGNSVIMMGVTIGDCATVNPLSVVTKDVPAYSLVSGNPARVFQRYDEEYLRAEAERVRAENAALRAEAQARGEAPVWGSPARRRDAQ